MKKLCEHPSDFHLSAYAGPCLCLRENMVRHIQSHVKTCELCKEKLLTYMDENLEDYQLDKQLRQEHVISETYFNIWSKVIEFKNNFTGHLDEMISKLSQEKDIQDVLALTYGLKFPIKKTEKPGAKNYENVSNENEEAQILLSIKTVLSILTDENIEISKRAKFAESLSYHLREVFPGSSE